MALSVSKGTITVPAVTGNVSYTTGFTPVAVIFWVTRQTADGFAAGQQMGFGVCAGSNGEFCHSALSSDNVATSVRQKSFFTNSVHLVSSVGSTDLAATWVSFDGTGFTLNWTTVISGVLVHYLALGGSDVANAAVGNILGPSATGIRDEITTLGFTPTLLFTLPFGSFTAPPSTANHSHMGFGAAMSATKRWATVMAGQNGVAAAPAKKWQRSDACLLVFETNATELQRADFVDFTPSSGTGWRFNWAVTGGVARRYGYLAMNITGSIDVGVSNKPTDAAPVTQSVTNGFQPSAVMLAAFGNVASTVSQANAELSIGGSDGTNEGTVWSEDLDASNPTEANDGTSQTKALLLATGPSTTNAEADLTMVSNGFQLNWTTNDAVASEIAYVALGSQAAATVVQSQYGPTIFRVQPRRWG